MRILRPFFLLALGLFATLVQAASASGIWSAPQGSYLLLMEQPSASTLVAVAVAPDLRTASAYSGTRSGDAVTLGSIDGRTTLSIIISGQTYSGTISSQGGSSATSGELLLAYAGSEHDGIWQHAGGADRYLATVTVSSGGTRLMVLVDLTLSDSAALAADVATGVVQSVGGRDSFAGRSLVSGNSVTLSFAATEPASAAYKVATATRPPATVEQFDVSRLLAVD